MIIKAINTNMLKVSVFYLKSTCSIKRSNSCLQIRKFNHFLTRFNKPLSDIKCIHSFSIPKPISYTLNNDRCMAGHSKWQNIRFIKAEKDKEKQLVSTKYVRLIRYAVRESGPDPHHNIRLRHLLEEARKNNIAKDTLDNAMKRGSDKKNKFGTMEILCPGGSMLIVEYETASISEIRHDIKVLCKKYSANVLPGEGRWRAVFEQKGIIISNKALSGEQLDEEKALDSAIEAGAEEVHTKENEEGKKYLEFVCAPDDLHKVKKEVEKQYEVEESYVAYIPTTTVQLNDEDMKSMDSFLEEMGNLADVVRMYENVQ